MKLKKVQFNNVFCSSGSRGIFNQGYWYSKFLDYANCTFVSKTVTAFPQIGNMSIDDYGNPLQLKPKCIHVDFVNSYVVNAVGLSNPGINTVINANIWQNIPEPFVISFMAVKETEIERRQEYIKFFDVIENTVFKSPFAIEINLSCPNVQHHSSHNEIFSIVNDININNPIIINLSVDFNPEFVESLSLHPNISAISLANTIKWGTPNTLDWNKFGKSPLEKFGGGGISGKPLLPLLISNLNKLKNHNITKPIIVGGGILSTDCIDKIIQASQYVKAIKLGTVCMLRPWRLKKIISYSNNILKGNS